MDTDLGESRTLTAHRATELPGVGQLMPEEHDAGR